MDFVAGPLDGVLVDYTVRGSEEGQDVRDEVVFVGVEFVAPRPSIIALNAIEAETTCSRYSSSK